MIFPSQFYLFEIDSRHHSLRKLYLEEPYPFIVTDTTPFLIGMYQGTPLTEDPCLRNAGQQIVKVKLGYCKLPFYKNSKLETFQ